MSKKEEDNPLGLVVMNEEEKYWHERLEECNKAIFILEKELKMNLAIKELCEKKKAEGADEEGNSP